MILFSFRRRHPIRDGCDNMDKSHPLSTPMVVRPLDVNKDPFRPWEKDEELLDPKVPYLSAIRALKCILLVTYDLIYQVTVNL